MHIEIYDLYDSFSTIHTTGYSLIAIQEMNLAYHYPIIYWNCACLSVDSSAINNSDFYNLVDEDIIDIEDEEDKKAQNKMDYTKLAAALDKFRNVCTINLPDINESRLSFTPDTKSNSILYGLKGINRITDPAIEEIMMWRPFSSLNDFLSKITKKVITKDKVVNLIKSGAFNKIENTDNQQKILEKYIWQVCEPKKRLTMQNANMLIDYKLFPESLSYYCEVNKLTKELRKNRDENKIWYCGDRIEIPEDKIEVWKQIFKDSNIPAQEIIINNEPRMVISSNKWDKFYESNMIPLKEYIKENHDTLLEKLNNILFTNEYNKYCDGDVLQWQLDALNFYFSAHPLTKAIPQITRETGISIDRVVDIVEDAQDGEFFIKGKIIPKMKLFTIAGTVIDKNKVKGIVTIQCPSGVVNLKLYKDLFSTFVAIDEETEQNSFFEKGTHLLVTGIQRGSTFIPKVYKNLNRKSILKINLDNEGNFTNLEEKIDLN